MFDGITIDSCTGIETIGFRDELAKRDVVTALGAIRERAATDSLRLLDLRALTFELSQQAISSLAAPARALDRPGARVALLVDSDLNYAFCRQHLAYRASDIVPVEVFRNEAEARAWLVGP